MGEAVLGQGWDFSKVLGLLAVPAILAAIAILSSRRAESGIAVLAAH